MKPLYCFLFTLGLLGFMKNKSTSKYWMHITKLGFLLLLLFVFFIPQNAFSQVNNCLDNPTFLTIGTTCSLTNYNVISSFTNDGPATCSGTSYRDGWYRFTTDATTTLINVDGTSANSGRHIGLAVYSGTCGSFTQVACTVPGTANANLTSVTVSPSTTYYLRLMRTSTGNNNMTGTICVYKTPMIVPTSGNNSYTTCSGTLYDNGGSAGDYANNSNGYTVINSASPSSVVQVSGSITAEGGYDYLTIYDGVGTGGTVLWGGSAHGSGTSCQTFTVPSITSTTGSLTVRFYSDVSGRCSGFALNISCVSCFPPTNLNVDNITKTSARFTWTAASPAPGSGYEIYYNTTGTAPNAGTTPTATVGAGVTQYTTPATLTPNTVYYYWVRSNCDGTDKSIWVSGGYFNTLPNYDCLHGDGQIKGEIVDGNGVTIGDVFRVADDIIVPAGKILTVKQITLEALSGNTVNNAIINIRADNGGSPGAVVGTATMAPSASSLYTTAFGFNVYHLTFNLATPIVLNAGTYWLEVTMSRTGRGDVYWRVTNTGTYGAVAQNSGNSGTSWVPNSNGYNMVYFVAGDCEDFTCPTFSPTISIGGATTTPGSLYPTLTAAIVALANCGITQPTALVLNSSYSSAGETFPITIPAIPGSTTTNTLTIKPGTGVTKTISGSVASNALIILNGASNVIIDGSNNGTTTRNLTINNSNGPTVWIGGSAGNTATNVQVKNSILSGIATNSNLVVSDASTIGNPGYFTNITIQNNQVQKAFMGIYANAAVVAGNGNGLLITGNLLNSSGANSLTEAGIYVQGVGGAATITNNTIGNMSASNDNMMGIWVASNTNNVTVSGNTISDITNTGIGNYVVTGIYVSSGNTATAINIYGNTISSLTGYSSYVNGVTGIVTVGETPNINIYSNKISTIKNSRNGGYTSSGIFLGSTSTSANAYVYNNFIWGVSAYGDGNANNSIYNGHGILVYQGAGYKLYHNTVYMGTNQTTAGTSAALYVYSNVNTNNALDVRNNIFYNAQTTGTRYAVYSAVTAARFQDINYNEYYSTGSIGYLGSARANLAAWQTATGKDANSLNVLPAFTSSTDLHLAAGNAALKTGTVIAGITDDIDGDLRNPITPTMGADEFQLANWWTGNSSTNWGTGTNWDNAVVPSSSADITIPYGVPNMPVLDADRTIGNLSFIGTTGTATVSLNNHKLTIGGAISGTGTFTGTAAAGISNSELVLNGAAGTVSFTQTDASTRSLNNLTLGASGTATLGSALEVYGNVQVNNTATNALNFASQNVTLKSNVNNTATIDKLNTNGTNLANANNITAERWLPLRNSGGTGSGTGINGRAYRLLTSTVSSATATINASWQEGLKNTAIGTYIVPPAPYQNFGTHITGAGGSANGFDITQTNESSLYTFTNGSNINSTLGYPAVTSTNLLIDGRKAYFIYIRGDRNVSTQLAYQSGGGMPTSSTTLRAKGSILQGSVPFNISAINGDFSLITNPYPAPLDWDAVSAANPNISTFYTYWDPSYGIRGGFVTIPTASATHRYIQPGEGFFVQKNSTGGGTVTITEAMKAVGNNDNTVFFTEHTPFESFRVGLFLTEDNNVRHTADEVLIRYDNNYAAGIDYDDAEEINNWNENIAISRAGTRLAIESRPVITDKDTIPLYISGLRKTAYDFEFTPSLFSNTGLIAELVDNYLHTRTLLSVTDNVTVPFTVNTNAASFANNRFMVVFSKPAGPLPIDMSSIKAYEKGSGIQVDWVMNTEQDMDRYEVEKSTDGRHFTKESTVASRGNSTIQVNYGWFDVNPIVGDNFYRIKSFEKSGANKYSSIVRVNISKGGSTDISIYPNPFEGTGFNLQMNKLAAGTYNLTMYNNLGQQVYSGTVQHGGGSGTQYINLGKDLAAGTYTVKISSGNTELVRTITKK